MTLDKRINSFVLLGSFLKQFPTGDKNDLLGALNQQFYTDFEELILRQKSYNGWFEKENVLEALNSIVTNLSEEKLKEWISNYSLEGENRRIGVIMAGNIPLVGFHDFLSVLITGNTLVAKLSSNDKTLLPKITEILQAIAPEFKGKVSFVERLENFDAVIATGSDNSSRYFDYYFGKYPHIIRKNRNSVAIIHENDTPADLKPLGKDIFKYYGLGCRNVSKLYFPKNYSINHFFEAIIDDYQNVVHNNKYANNYDYNKAVYLLGNNQLLDNDFVLLKEDKALASPVGVLYYEYYNDIKQLEEELNEKKGDIQCIVSSSNTPLKTLGFGMSQSPALDDYADGVDTMQFLLNLA
ncbi:MAG: acyl-CoA reductase [Vicingus serpentipes]|nr:acyl-CoA reductase [Vicingus serpentipes]